LTTASEKVDEFHKAAQFRILASTNLYVTIIIRRVWRWKYYNIIAKIRCMRCVYRVSSWFRWFGKQLLQSRHWQLTLVNSSTALSRAGPQCTPGYHWQRIGTNCHWRYH